MGLCIPPPPLIHHPPSPHVGDVGQRALVGKVNMDQECPDTYCEDTQQSLQDTRRWGPDAIMLSLWFYHYIMMMSSLIMQLYIDHGSWAFKVHVWPRKSRVGEGLGVRLILPSAHEIYPKQHRNLCDNWSSHFLITHWWPTDHVLPLRVRYCDITTQSVFTTIVHKLM